MLDGYRIERQVHASSRSHLYLATHVESGAQVVLKLPSVELRDDSTYLRRLFMEEWIARRIESPHVLKAAPPQIRTSLYTAMEYVEAEHCPNGCGTIRGPTWKPSEASSIRSRLG